MIIIIIVLLSIVICVEAIEVFIENYKHGSIDLLIDSNLVYRSVLNFSVLKKTISIWYLMSVSKDYMYIFNIDLNLFLFKALF